MQVERVFFLFLFMSLGTRGIYSSFYCCCRHPTIGENKAVEGFSGETVTRAWQESELSLHTANIMVWISIDQPRLRIFKA